MPCLDVFVKQALFLARAVLNVKVIIKTILKCIRKNVNLEYIQPDRYLEKILRCLSTKKIKRFIPDSLALI